MTEKKNGDMRVLCAVWFSSIRALSALQRRVLLEELGSAEEVYKADAALIKEVCERRKELSRVTGGALKRLCSKDTSKAESILRTCRLKGIKTVIWGSEEYPKRLAQISDPPSLLYAIGDLSLFNTACAAVVGTRRSSPYGRWAAFEIGKRIGSAGVTLVSGMAEGIDSWGHKGCLEVGGRTAAVLGTGVDVCFPRSNAGLYKRIASEGLIVSEYVPGESGRACNFPERNRIISGLSSAVIVVEGALKSGSMITAGLAAEQGRDVYAVPGNINQPNSVGVNKLIADGAYPVFTLEGLEESLGLKVLRARKEAEAMGPLERRLLALAAENPGAGCEFFAAKLDESPVMMRTLLMAMELKGLVRCENEAYFVC